MGGSFSFKLCRVRGCDNLAGIKTFNFKSTKTKKSSRVCSKCFDTLLKIRKDHGIHMYQFDIKAQNAWREYRKKAKKENDAKKELQRQDEVVQHTVNQTVFAFKDEIGDEMLRRRLHGYDQLSKEEKKKQLLKCA